MRSEDKDDYDRFRNDDAPLHVWETLLEKYPLANEWVARNRKSPLQILHRLASDERSLVRTHVASVRRITEQTQLILAKDKEYSVRHTLAYNAKATRKVLEILSKDLESNISEKAIERLNAKNG